MNHSTDYKLLFSLIAVGIIWGTTFLGIRVAIETIPPWYSTSIRNFIAALIVGKQPGQQKPTVTLDEWS